MTFKEDLQEEVKKIFRDPWTTRDGIVVPSADSLKLSNDGIKLDATVLYADLSESTSMVDSKSKEFAAEVYKTYLLCAGRIIRKYEGVITAYDGDRIMAVYMGDYKNTSAVKTALQINYAVREIINPAITSVYGEGKYTVKQVVGIDTSNLMAARTGFRGSNDIVWVGRAANYAAKLCSLDGASTYITNSIYDRLNDEAKYSNGTNMWEKRSWTAMNGMTIYRSNYMKSL